MAISVGVMQILAQAPSESPKPLNNFQETQEKVCREQSISQNRTYNFRQLPQENPYKGWFGEEKPPPLTWYQKLFPFLRPPVEKYGAYDVRTLKSEFGRPVPVGETMRSKALRAKTEQSLPEVEQKAKLPKYDWRENGIDVGAVGDQEICNLCWAFAGIDALQISRQLSAIRLNKTFESKKRPSVRQLVACMVKNPEDHCKINWHGEAFSFMVKTGLPLGGITKYKVSEAKIWDCEPDTYIKALTWDFVSAKPQEVAPTDEIKKAIIQYGSVISMISFDNCYFIYGGGIFNEEQFKNGSHLVLIIGWDDAKGAWLIKNSHGKDWGEGGFGWIKYKSNNIGQWSAVVVADPQEEERIAKEIENQEKEQ
ncbi:MAG TPA: C1 family peptidase [Pyrinomonadaceae bacterium]|nr:C1 family peptidase [Pyrinomonadaceae bacterium]